MNHGPVLEYFEAITKIPRPSKHEEKMRKYLLAFARDHHLSAREDAAGNICIVREPDPACRDAPAVVLQSHMDMVCEKDQTKTINFETDPIETEIVGDWIYAKGTTLGADNGIGIAYSLAALTENIRAGKIECLFTVDEETGLTGAKAVSAEMFEGSLLINLDSEEEGAICTGCAGGVETVAEISWTPVSSPAENVYFRITIDGLSGGHSGMEIHLGRANSIKILAEFLAKITAITVCRLSGGNLSNAIPRHAEAVFGIPEADVEHVRDMFSAFECETIKKYEQTDPHISLSLEPKEVEEKSIPNDVARELIAALNACQNGVIAMSAVIPDLVQTSTNLAAIEMKDNSLAITTLQRSVSESEKFAVSKSIAELFEQCGAVVITENEFPGWMPDPNSPLLQTAIRVHEKMYGARPLVGATHGGLECGLFKRVRPELDMIAIGPNITGAHSPKERMQISSANRVWEYLCEILEEIGEKK
ncbi:beta-Ala-His dipeptidase [Methanorbis rubei]|uniref:Cytosol non-specific dipeptidase n=1 Tax=Methanorbis rubei TaxID=3028300 RepID=A0AAE4MFL9_9EURY|nr:Cytosol non-specific dipeptidase [Methanocorpusculaceae archaeon Cs1]